MQRCEEANAPGRLFGAVLFESRHQSRGVAVKLLPRASSSTRGSMFPQWGPAVVAGGLQPLQSAGRPGELQCAVACSTATPSLLNGAVISAEAARFLSSIRSPHPPILLLLFAVAALQ